MLHVPLVLFATLLPYPALLALSLIVWYNLSMKKLPAIGAWFCLFIFIMVAALFWMPDSYRIHPRLKIPDIVFLRSQPLLPKPLDMTVLLVGGCTAIGAPWPYPKITAPELKGHESKLYKRLRQNRPGGDPDTILIMYGMSSLYTRPYDREAWLAMVQPILDLAKASFPNANIIVVDIFEIRDLCQIPGLSKDPFHLNHLGYFTLKARHPEWKI